MFKSKLLGRIVQPPALSRPYRILKSMKERLGIGVVGCGYWGPNLIRNFYSLPECELKTICDLDIKRLNHLKNLYPKVEVSTDFQQIVARSDIDALVIATSAPTHYAMAKQALSAGKHVFIEKP